MAIPADKVIQAFDPFTADELWALRRFTRKVDELKGSAFAQSETTLTGVMVPGVETLGGPAFQIGVEGPSEEQVKAVIGDFRQLYTDTNKASASRVMNILKASAKRQGNAISTEVIDALRNLKTRIKRRKAHDPRGVFLEETTQGESVERTPGEIVSIWLNGEYLHEDLDLADLLDPPGHMSNEMMRMSLQMSIRDFIAYWTAIQQLVDVVLESPRLIAASP
jgi:hypothetical protein